MRLERSGKNFFNGRIFFVVLDDKFDVPGKAASYPVAEVSGNYFYQAKLSILVENYHKVDER